jgi:hypothetical protein
MELGALLAGLYCVLKRSFGRRHAPVLKNTRSVLIGYENFLFYLILQPLTSRTL